MKALLCACLIDAAPAQANECVVLLHGLGRTPQSMAKIGTALRASGYTVVNQGYASRTATIEQSSQAVAKGIAQCRDGNASQIHFVTHSAGAILLRWYFQSNVVTEAGRAVMLAPPDHGSEIVDRYRDRWWFRAATGPAGQQLGTGEDSLPKSLQPIELEIGIIAGTKTNSPWFSRVIDGPDDGKVSTESAALPEMRDYLIVKRTHTFMPHSADVIEQIKTFLRDGRFARQ